MAPQQLATLTNLQDYEAGCPYMSSNGKTCGKKPLHALKHPGKFAKYKETYKRHCESFLDPATDPDALGMKAKAVELAKMSLCKSCGLDEEIRDHFGKHLLSDLRERQEKKESIPPIPVDHPPQQNSDTSNSAHGETPLPATPSPSRRSSSGQGTPPAPAPADQGSGSGEQYLPNPLKRELENDNEDDDSLRKRLCTSEKHRESQSQDLQSQSDALRTTSAHLTKAYRVIEALGPVIRDLRNGRQRLMDQDDGTNYKSLYDEWSALGKKAVEDADEAMVAEGVRDWGGR